MAGLIRYASAELYYARFRSGGKLVWRSLKTDTLSVAKLRLADLRKQEEVRSARGRRTAGGKLTLGDVAKIHLEHIAGQRNLKPRTRAYQAKVLSRIARSWPDWDRADAGRIQLAELQRWSASFTAGASVFNHAVGLLRKLFAIVVEAGGRYDNPARGLKRAAIKPTRLTLPSSAQFDAFVRAIESSGSGWSRPCAELMRFLAFGGFRKSEAANVRWAHVDFGAGRIHVVGNPVTGTKSGLDRFIPIIPAMRTLLERLRADCPEAEPQDFVMEVRECQKAMDRAAAQVGMARPTHHTLRHLFATRCIEAGVDIRTVAAWLGHQDNGVLALRIYGHVRDEHSAAQAAKATFGQQHQVYGIELWEGHFGPGLMLNEEPNFRVASGPTKSLQLLSLRVGPLVGGGNPDVEGLGLAR